MKQTLKFCYFLLLLLPALAFTVKPNADNNYCIIKDVSPAQAITAKTAKPIEKGTYFFLAVSGVYQKSNTAYTSRIIYYKGSEDCNDQKKEVFHRQAKIAFNKFLTANYNDEFPDGSTNISVHEFRGTTAKTGDYMFTKDDAQTRLYSWKAEEVSHGYTVQNTIFSYSCE